MLKFLLFVLGLFIMSHGVHYSMEFVNSNSRVWWLGWVMFGVIIMCCIRFAWWVIERKLPEENSKTESYIEDPASHDARRLP
jgi:ABC-type multidrug transport system permease subunit